MTITSLRTAGKSILLASVAMAFAFSAPQFAAAKSADHTGSYSDTGRDQDRDHGKDSHDVGGADHGKNHDKGHGKNGRDGAKDNNKDDDNGKGKDGRGHDNENDRDSHDNGWDVDFDS